MKRIVSLLAGFALAGAAVADEKVEVKQERDPNHQSIEKIHKHGRSTDKTRVESKARHRMGGGTVSKTETTEEHDRPGMRNRKKTTSETVERDAQGNVVRHEKTVKQ